jgi:outer membrane immunogenic protein
MKKLLGAVALSALLVAPAMAADLRMPVKAPPIAVAMYNWGGFYFGGHAGYGWGDADWEFINDPAPRTFTDHRLRGFVGGVHTGYNWQSGRFVFGIEGSVSATKMEGSSFCPVATFRCESDVDHFWRAGGRAGFAAGETGNWLFYATAGFARVKLDTHTPLIATGVDTGSASHHHHGWYAGGGFEWGLTPNFTIGVEAFRVSVGTERHFEPVLAFTTRDVELDFTVALARATYRFNWGAPVVARY